MRNAAANMACVRPAWHLPRPGKMGPVFASETALRDSPVLHDPPVGSYLCVVVRDPNLR
jgi:hypothetical protein